MEREKILSVSIRDCTVQHFRAGGKGGQNQNKRDTGTRVIHEPSGARGESREERSQLQNTRTAFLRMIETPAFKYWLSVETGRRKSEAELMKEIETELNDPANIKVEYKRFGVWVSA